MTDLMESNLKRIAELIKRRDELKEQYTRIQDLAAYPYDPSNNRNLFIEVGGGTVHTKIYPRSNEEIKRIEDFLLRETNDKLNIIEGQLKQYLK